MTTKLIHDWRFLAGHGQDAPGQSLDTYEQCSQCGAVRHDYRHGGGQRSSNYPEIWKLGARIPVDSPCLGLLGAGRTS